MGFDVPSLHNMCLDKPLKGHNLIQAIARVNRVYKDKLEGLIVDYLGIAEVLNIDVYSAHPYSSWERATNENTNGLLRK